MEIAGIVKVAPGDVQDSHEPEFITKLKGECVEDLEFGYVRRRRDGSMKTETGAFPLPPPFGNLRVDAPNLYVIVLHHNGIG